MPLRHRRYRSRSARRHLPGVRERGRPKMAIVLLTAGGNFLVPTTSPVTVLLTLALVALMIWALVDTASHRRWGWFWAMFVFGPFAALGWMAVRQPSAGQRQPE